MLQTGLSLPKWDCNWLITGITILQISNTFSGWWYTYPSEKYEFVSWDHDTQYMEQ